MANRHLLEARRVENQWQKGLKGARIVPLRVGKRAGGGGDWVDPFGINKKVLDHSQLSASAFPFKIVVSLLRIRSRVVY